MAEMHTGAILHLIILFPMDKSQNIHTGESPRIMQHNVWTHSEQTRVVDILD